MLQYKLGYIFLFQNVYASLPVIFDKEMETSLHTSSQLDEGVAPFALDNRKDDLLLSSLSLSLMASSTIQRHPVCLFRATTGQGHPPCCLGQQEEDVSVLLLVALPLACHSTYHL